MSNIVAAAYEAWDAEEFEKKNKVSVDILESAIDMDAYVENPALCFRNGRFYTHRGKINQEAEEVDVTEQVAEAIAKYLKEE